jgi:hypothetical protein
MQGSYNNKIAMYARADVNNLGFINYSQPFNKAARHESTKVINLYGLQDFPTIPHILKKLFLGVIN